MLFACWLAGFVACSLVRCGWLDWALAGCSAPHSRQSTHRGRPAGEHAERALLESDFTWTGGCLTLPGRPRAPGAHTALRLMCAHRLPARAWRAPESGLISGEAGNGECCGSQLRSCVRTGSAILPLARPFRREVRDGRARMILRQVRVVAPRLARRLSARTLDTPFISDSIPVRASLVG